MPLPGGAAWGERVSSAVLIYLPQVLAQPPFRNGFQQSTQNSATVNNTGRASDRNDSSATPNTVIADIPHRTDQIARNHHFTVNSFNKVIVYAG